jgi:hypothetical protein
MVQAYKRMAESIKSAKNRIYILSAAFPNPEYPIQPSLFAARQEFLQAIEDIITAKLEDSQAENFKYVRVLQSNSSEITDHSKSDGILRSEHVDCQTFEHCHRVWQKLCGARESDQDHIDFQFVIRKPVLSCPSILVVDNETVHLAVMGERKVLKKRVVDKTAKVQGMVTITDTSGRAGVAEHYVMEVINKLAEDAVSIIEVS